MFYPAERKTFPSEGRRVQGRCGLERGEERKEFGKGS
tara:strand:+ start:77031 stop:77141 length:111 start_codon:yes stop_codon:yes gene_type:complete